MKQKMIELSKKYMEDIKATGGNVTVILDSGESECVETTFQEFSGQIGIMTLHAIAVDICASKEGNFDLSRFLKMVYDLHPAESLNIIESLKEEVRNATK